MRYRTVVIIFNALFLIGYLVLLTLPFLLVDLRYGLDFWSRYWSTPTLLLISIATFDILYLRYGGYISLTEKSDWNAISEHLEDMIYAHLRFDSIYISGLIQSYLAQSRIQRIYDLEQFFRRKRPRIISQYGLYFGTYYFLNSEREDMQNYFDMLRVDRHFRFTGWAHWAYAFALMRRKLYTNAKTVLIRLLRTNRDPFLLVNTLYLLNLFSDIDPEVLQEVNENKNMLYKRYQKHTIERFRRQRRLRVFTIVISSLVDDAITWIFDQPQSEVSSAAQEVIDV